MDVKALINRAKTRVRYYLVSDLWIKKVITAIGFPTGSSTRWKPIRAYRSPMNRDVSPGE